MTVISTTRLVQHVLMISVHLNKNLKKKSKTAKQILSQTTYLVIFRNYQSIYWCVFGKWEENGESHEAPTGDRAEGLRAVRQQCYSMYPSSALSQSSLTEIWV